LFHFNHLPNEIILQVLTHALGVTRITPTYAHVFGANSKSRCLSQVSWKVCDIAREAYYQEHLVIVGKVRFSATLDTVLVPSGTIGASIRRLEVRVRIEEYTHREIMALTSEDRSNLLAKGELEKQMEQDLGILLHPRDGSSRRTAWQAHLMALRELKIVFTCKGGAA
jgi:hypothetical protein